MLWDHKRNLLSRIHVLNVGDIHLPCNVPVLQMKSWGTVKLKASLSLLPPAPGKIRSLEVSEMLRLLSCFSTLREGMHFYKTCRELKVSLLSVFKRSWKVEERILVLEAFGCWSEERVLAFTATAHKNGNVTQGSERHTFIACPDPQVLDCLVVNIAMLQRNGSSYTQRVETQLWCGGQNIHDWNTE